MASSGEALQRINIAERSYTRVGQHALVAKQTGKISAAHPYWEFLTLLGQEIAGWKVTATALAYKSPGDALDSANEKIRAVWRAGAELARLTGDENPAFDPKLVGADQTSWAKWIVLGILLVVGVPVAIVIYRKVG
jgi:hypothetical protein